MADRKWKRTGVRQFTQKGDGYFAEIFGSTGRYPRWAWSVYGHGQSASGVKITIAAARHAVNELMDKWGFQ